MTRRETAQEHGITIPRRIGEASEVNYGTPSKPDYGPLDRDRIPVRAMRADDLRGLIAIDRRITGADRSLYFERKLDEALHESDVRVSLVAELDGGPVGFVMARVDFGEFGVIEPAAVLDTIGVHPDYGGRGVGRALLSQLLINLRTLRVERLRTEIGWHDHELLAFFDRCDFESSQRLCLQYELGA